MQISSLSQKKETNSKARKYILIALVISIILLFILLALLVIYPTLTPKALTVFIDGKETKFANDTFIFENNGDVWISLKDIANSIGYRHNDGEYKQYTEDKDKCYLESDDEVTNYKLGEDKIYKTLNDDNVQYSEFGISAPVKEKDGKLYVNSKGLSIGCNLQFLYNKNANQITINTLKSLYDSYNKKVTNKEYPDVDSLDENFSNKKAILYGMLVAKSTIKGEEKYGVISLDGKTKYLGLKYDQIQFIEDTQSFLVKGDEKYGIMTSKGEPKVAIEYDTIVAIDTLNDLYYVTKDEKVGIMHQNGDFVGGEIYDQIGVNVALFPKDNIKNNIILYKNCIPVKKGEKWGFINTEGDALTKFIFEDIGYIDANSKANTNNVLLIEDKEGIVVKRNGQYGVIDSEGEELVPCVYNNVQAVKEGNNTTYYFERDGVLEKLK